MLEQGCIYNGFRFDSEKWIEEVYSTAKIFYHEKSGARLLYLENNDDNKVFSITFRTPPTDSTGVAHIIEHSVLCGSRKYPLKEPFVELVKGSLNTFLNAMTFPDKTMYPVASRNDKDFRNLMDVYLDAVFYPNIYSTPETLMQEGWHYHLPSPEAELTYKGVVYNEMKGVFSSPDAILEKTIFESLFPDTTYGAESGGDPDFIPTLTAEQFLDFHRQYYHPSNSYIFLYGSLDILDNLKFLDEAYLGNFNKMQVNSRISLQNAFEKRVDKIVDYPVAMGENLQDKTLMSLNFVVGHATDAENSLAFQMLEYMLLETPAAPLKKALTAAGIGKDVAGTFVKSILQPTLGIIVTGANENQKEQFVEIVFNELSRLVKEGIDKQLIQAVVNIFEFTLREANFGTRPKGLIYNIKCMDSWLYDGEPLAHLEYGSAMEKIKMAIEGNYFEDLIKNHLLNNRHQVSVVLRPKPGLAEERSEILKNELAKYKATLSSREIEALVQATKRLKVLQETPDSQENLSSIPLLQLSDIEPHAEKLPILEKHYQNGTVLLHPLFTNGIAYVNLYFDTMHISQEDVPYIYILAELLGKVSTAHYDYAQLANEINIHTGGITYETIVYTDKNDDAKLMPKFVIKSKVLVEKIPELFDLLTEIINSSDFLNEKRIREILHEIKANWDLALFRRGQQLVSNRVLSYFSPAAWYGDMGLLSFYTFVCQWEREFSSEHDSLLNKLQKVAKALFNQQNLLTSVTVDEKQYPKFELIFQGFYKELSREPIHPGTLHFNFSKRNEGLMTSGKVQYVVKGANFRKAGYNYHGTLRVLETILRYDYLWNRVRVQGGAYGGFAKFERNGNMVFGSYRDPNLIETLKVFDETQNYLKNFSVTEREMLKYIIGTMSQVDMPLTSQQKGERATAQYIRSISIEDVQKERDEILATQQSDIRRLSEMVGEAMRQEYLCVMGSEQKIKEHADKFGELVQVFK